MNMPDISLAEECLKDRAKGLTAYYSSKRLNIPVGVIEETIRESLKEDFNSLFKGG